MSVFLVVDLLEDLDTNTLAIGGANECAVELLRACQIRLPLCVVLVVISIIILFVIRIVMIVVIVIVAVVVVMMVMLVVITALAPAASQLLVSVGDEGEGGIPVPSIHNMSENSI